jgi:hypothetical protein
MNWRKLINLTEKQAKDLGDDIYDRWFELNELKDEMSLVSKIDIKDLRKDKILSIRINSNIKDILLSKGYTVQTFLDEKINEIL